VREEEVKEGEEEEEEGGGGAREERVGRWPRWIWWRICGGIWKGCMMSRPSVGSSPMGLSWWRCGFIR